MVCSRYDIISILCVMVCSRYDIISILCVMVCSRYDIISILCVMVCSRYDIISILCVMVCSRYNRYVLHRPTWSVSHKRGFCHRRGLYATNVFCVLQTPYDYCATNVVILPRMWLLCHKPGYYATNVITVPQTWFVCHREHRDRCVMGVQRATGVLWVRRKEKNRCALG